MPPPFLAEFSNLKSTFRRRLVVIVMLMALPLLSACGSGGLFGGPAEPTALPFNRFSAQQVLTALIENGLAIQNIQRDMLVGRDAPSTFSDRYIFEIEQIAPNGGQLLIFNTPEDMAAWENYINSLRANASTRRSVVYVFTHGNAMLQLNASLTNEEANRYRAVLLGLDR